MHTVGKVSFWSLLSSTTGPFGVLTTGRFWKEKIEEIQMFLAAIYERLTTGKLNFGNGLTLAL